MCSSFVCRCAAKSVIIKSLFASNVERRLSTKRGEEIKHLCKESDFTAEMLKVVLAKGRKKDEILRS